MSIIFSGISSLLGVAGGVVQDLLNSHKERKEKQLNFQQQRALQELENKHQLELAKQNISLSNNETIQAREKTKQEDLKLEKQRFKEITEATEYTEGKYFFINFLRATTRPILSYFFFFLSAYLVIFSVQNNVGESEKYITMILYITEYIVAFWFYRRSSDKIQNTLRNKY